MLHDIEGNTIETIDERNERLADDTLDCAGVCKDCSNGTLNNELNPAFEEYGDDRSKYCTAHTTEGDGIEFNILENSFDLGQSFA